MMQPSQIDLLILSEYDLEQILFVIAEQETIYSMFCRCLDPEDLVNTLPELEPTEELLQILYTKRNQIAERIELLIQNN